MSNCSFADSGTEKGFSDLRGGGTLENFRGGCIAIYNSKPKCCCIRHILAAVVCSTVVPFLSNQMWELARPPPNGRESGMRGVWVRVDS